MTNKIIQSFPFGTAYSSFEEWSGNFIQWYGKEAIGQGTDDNWQEIAHQIVNTPSFSAYGIKSPNEYDTWQEWAEDITLAINGPTH
jgi:hypothetical protein